MISILTGKVVQVLPTQSGVSKSGNAWEQRNYIIKTNEMYPKSIHVDTLKAINLTEGEDVRLGVEIESHEYNGKWYTNVRIIGKVDENNKLLPIEVPTTDSNSPTEETDMAYDDSSNDLPF